MRIKWAAAAAAVGTAAACGFLLGSAWSRGNGLQTADRTILYYRDPMHPSYRSPHPGRAPDCGMELVPVYSDVTNSFERSIGEGSDSVDTIHLTAAQQRLAGVQLGRAERSTVSYTVRTTGRVAVDENRVSVVTAGADGWTTELGVATATGESVTQNQRLASVYGPDYATAQRTFLYALRASENSRSVPAAQEQLGLTVMEARKALIGLGFSELQIRELASTREVKLDAYVSAPTSGVVLMRNVAAHQRFERGAELFRIADLHSVWVLADALGGDAAHIRPGSTARVTIAGRPEVSLAAKVSAALPRFDAPSRTLKIRLETGNPDLVLRPDMLVDVEFPIALPEAETVSADAVADFGSGAVVFVQHDAGEFERRSVSTGWRLGGRVQILDGLAVGEPIAVSGVFLLESEHRTRRDDARGHD
jgi:Cu(I)/Ag(I) efflux system membrane fusion protein